MKERNFIKKASNFLIIAIPIQGILYFLWIYLNYRLYLFLHIPNYQTITEYWGLMVLASFCLFIGALFLSGMHKSNKILISSFTLLSAMLVCCGTIASLVRPESVEDSARVGNDVYEITTYLNSHGNACYSLYQCTAGKIACDTIFEKCDVNFYPTKIIIDPDKGEIKLLINRKIVFTAPATTSIEK